MLLGHHLVQFAVNSLARTLEDHITESYLLSQHLNKYIYLDTSSVCSVGFKSPSLSKMMNNGSECDAV
jgi:hypothetical protein